MPPPRTCSWWTTGATCHSYAPVTAYRTPGVVEQRGQRAISRDHPPRADLQPRMIPDGKIYNRGRPQEHSWTSTSRSRPANPADPRNASRQVRRWLGAMRSGPVRGALPRHLLLRGEYTSGEPPAWEQMSDSEILSNSPDRAQRRAGQRVPDRVGGVGFHPQVLVGRDPEGHGHLPRGSL